MNVHNFLHIYNIFFIFCLISACYSQEDSTETSNHEPEFQPEEDFPNEVETLLSSIELLPPTSESNVTFTETSNITTVTNTTEEAQIEKSNVTLKHVNCIRELGTQEVQIVNDTELIKLLMPNPNITTKETPANCLCVLFYSKHCPFSILAAPHFNALPRAFPDLKMVAINAIMYHIFNTQNGIVGVPSLLLLHNGKIIDKFNESDYTLEQFSKFITKNTGIAAEEKSFVTSADFAGPVASALNKETDILLVVAWAFIIICAAYYFTRSKWWRWIVESVKHNWRESEAQAQHEHVD